MSILYLIVFSLIVFVGIVIYKFRNEIRALIRAKMEEHRVLSQLRKEMLLKAKIKALQELEPELVQQMKEKELEKLSGDKLSKGMEKFAKMLGTTSGAGSASEKLAKMGVGRSNKLNQTIGDQGLSSIFNKDKLNQMLGKDITQNNTMYENTGYDNTRYEEQVFPAREMPQYQDVSHQNVRYNDSQHQKVRYNQSHQEKVRSRSQPRPQTELQGPNIKELVGIKKPNMEKLMGNFDVGRTLKPEEKLRRLLRK